MHFCVLRAASFCGVCASDFRVGSRLVDWERRIAQAVQLAYSEPRSRVLVFREHNSFELHWAAPQFARFRAMSAVLLADTGRLVGTGTSGAMAARLAMARAQRQLAVEAGVYLNVCNFSIINQVGAVSLRATLNCEGFASAHSSTSHFDRNSFVGLAWRPPDEDVCCEIYSTGRAKCDVYSNLRVARKLMTIFAVSACRVRFGSGSFCLRGRACFPSCSDILLRLKFWT